MTDGGNGNTDDGSDGSSMSDSNGGGGGGGGGGGSFYPEACKDVQIDSDSLSASKHSQNNVVENLVDNSINTRWSARGEGESFTIDLGQKTPLAGIFLSIYEGDQRTQNFEVLDGNGQPLIQRRKTSGKSQDLEFYPFDSDADTSVIKFIGYGNMKGGMTSTWNSISGVELCGAMTVTSNGGTHEDGEPCDDDDAAKGRRLRGSSKE
ncbi:unnamed protein product [Discosporangium mesarthrocarpum]